MKEALERWAAILAMMATLVWLLWPSADWTLDPEPLSVFSITVVAWIVVEVRSVINGLPKSNDVEIYRMVNGLIAQAKIEVQHRKSIKPFVSSAAYSFMNSCGAAFGTLLDDENILFLTPSFTYRKGTLVRLMDGEHQDYEVVATSERGFILRLEQKLAAPVIKVTEDELVTDKLQSVFFAIDYELNVVPLQIHAISQSVFFRIGDGPVLETSDCVMTKVLHTAKGDIKSGPVCDQDGKLIGVAFSGNGQTEGSVLFLLPPWKLDEFEYDQYLHLLEEGVLWKEIQ